MTEQEEYYRQQEITIMAVTLFLADAEEYQFRRHCIVTYGIEWAMEFAKEAS